MLERYCGKTGSKQFGQDGKIGSLETLRGLEDPGDLEGPRSLKGLWGFGSSLKSQRSGRFRVLGRFRMNRTYGPGGLDGTEGQEVSGRSRGSKRFRRLDTF